MNTPQTAQPTFEARRLSKIYPTAAGDVIALDELDLEIYRGEMIILLGPSGSGKSTLVNILGGLDRPTSGEVLFKGARLTEFDDAALTRYRRFNIGFVFQFYNLIPSLSARENVALVTEIAADPLSPEDALHLVGLEDRMDHFPAQLSGGEQQRVAVARAVAKQPAVLLCDEPTGALDAKTGIRVLEAIELINRELGTTSIVITHNASIAGMADRVISMASGRVKSVETNAHKVVASTLSW